MSHLSWTVSATAVRLPEGKIPHVTLTSGRIGCTEYCVDNKPYVVTDRPSRPVQPSTTLTCMRRKHALFLYPKAYTKEYKKLHYIHIHV